MHFNYPLSYFPQGGKDAEDLRLPLTKVGKPLSPLGEGREGGKTIDKII
jgi:hypothetical protein